MSTQPPEYSDLTRAQRTTSQQPPLATDDCSCIFCKLHRPDLNRIMQQNETFYTRYDNYPAAPGHVEVVPKRHVESFFELTPRELSDAYALIVAAQERITEKLQPDGFTIGINEGQAAGRTVDHLHIHLIPRHFGDGEDPRGGIRRTVPNCDPDAWTKTDDSERPSPEPVNAIIDHPDTDTRPGAVKGCPSAHHSLEASP